MKNFFLSCFQTDNNIIECMFIDENDLLSIFIFNENLDKKDIKGIETNSNIEEKSLKCIHLQGEIGVYNYYFSGSSMAILKIQELKFDVSSY